MFNSNSLHHCDPALIHEVLHVRKMLALERNALAQAPRFPSAFGAS